MPDTEPSYLQKITSIFKDSELFDISAPSQKTQQKILDYPVSSDLIGYLNPIHRFSIHVISEQESRHLNALSSSDRSFFLKQLCNNFALVLVNISSNSLPDDMISHADFYIIQCKEHKTKAITSLQQLSSLLDNTIRTSETCEHGSFIVVNNQGILITGDSGAGKSHLLATLVSRGHMWVADDMAVFYQNIYGEIIGTSAGHLQAYIHMKGLGIVNLDDSFGMTSRLKKHSLAGIVHLSENMPEMQNSINEINPIRMKKIASQAFPVWEIHKTMPNPALAVEMCSKQIILNQWGKNADKEFSQSLNDRLNNSLQNNEV